jgi:RHS repeat-associated protein
MGAKSKFAADGCDINSLDEPGTKTRAGHARYYDPQVGRFMSQDPIGFWADVNFYRYANNNATRLRDPNGKDPVVGVLVGLVGGAVNAAVGSASTGGDALDIATSAIIGGVLGAGIGALDPTPGIGTLMLIGGGSAFAGDLLGQTLHFSKKCRPFNLGQLAGSTLAGTVSPLMGAPFANGFVAETTEELITNQIYSIGPSVLLPMAGKELGGSSGCGCN